MNKLDVNSIILYLVVYTVSIVFFYLSDREEFKKIVITIGGRSNTSIDGVNVYILLIAVIIPCVLAGLREPSVGTDALNYVVPNFDFANRTGVDFEDCLKNFPMKSEFLFTFLVYICAKFNNLFVLLFSIQLLVFIPMVIAVIRLRFPLAFTMSIFYLLFFNLTFGLMRQAIAASFLLLAYAFMGEKKYKYLIICITIAFLFHSSSIFMIVIYFMINWINNSNHQYSYYFIAILSMVILILGDKNISEVLRKVINPISIQYSSYIREQLTGRINLDVVSWSNIVVNSILIIYCTFLLVKEERFDKEASNLLFINILGVLMRIWSMKFLLAVRFAYYFDFFLLLYIPKAVYDKKEGTYGIDIARVAVIIPLAFVFWLFFYMYKNNLNTALYIFR